MAAAAYFIKKINQKDNFTFTIEWNDGKTIDYRLSELQSHCPCADCKEAKEGRIKNLNSEVRAKSVMSVGRYALRIDFTTGCTAGIYDFDFLRTLLTP